MFDVNDLIKKDHRNPTGDFSVMFFLERQDRVFAEAKAEGERLGHNSERYAQLAIEEDALWFDCNECNMRVRSKLVHPLGAPSHYEQRCLSCDPCPGNEDMEDDT